MNQHAINTWEFIFEVIELFEPRWTSDPVFTRFFIDMSVNYMPEFDYVFKKRKGLT